MATCPSSARHSSVGTSTARRPGWPDLRRCERIFPDGCGDRGTHLEPLPGDVDFTVGASLPMPGLTAWQGLLEHGRLQAGQSVLVHGAAGSVGTERISGQTIIRVRL